jgi:hypothetical protein
MKNAVLPVVVAWTRVALSVVGVAVMTWMYSPALHWLMMVLFPVRRRRRVARRQAQLRRVRSDHRLD